MRATGRGSANRRAHRGARRAAAATVGLSLALTLVPLAARAAPGASLGGTVTTADGGGLALPTVRVYDAVTGQDVASLRAEDDGTYVVGGLEPGSYVVRAIDDLDYFSYASRWYGGAYVQADATPVVLGEGESRDDVDVVLERSARVCTNLSTPLDEPAEDGFVTATTVDGAITRYGDPGFYAGTGLQCVDDIPPGEDWRISYGAPGLGTHWYDHATSAATATVVSLAAGQQLSFVAGMEWTSGVAGVVTGVGGTPLPGVTVTAQDPDDPNRTRAATTGPDGRYELRLPAGRWAVSFATADLSYLAQWYDGATSAEAAMPVVVSTDVVTPGIDAALAPAVAISDVDPADPRYADIRWMVDEGIATLTRDGAFQPHRHVSRSMMATFLHRLAGGGPSDTPTPVAFLDVRPRDAAYGDIVWAHQEGLVTAGPQGAFLPNRSITRADVAVALFRMLGEPAWSTPPPTSPYADVRAQDPAYAAVWWAVGEGLLTVRETARGARFDAGAAIERQDMAVLLHTFATRFEPIVAHG